MIYSRDELKQYQMSQNFSDKVYPAIRYFLGDVRDLERLRRALEDVDVVVHAAASEAGPRSRIQSVRVHQDQRPRRAEPDRGLPGHRRAQRVALSTDKAAAPINLYGATKLCSDKLFIAANNIKGNRDIRFSVVRYGNVMGSRGSVIPFFLEKRKSGVLPITDPNMTRFNNSTGGRRRYGAVGTGACLGRRGFRSQDSVLSGHGRRQCRRRGVPASSDRRAARREDPRGDDHRQRQFQHRRYREVFRDSALGGQYSLQDYCQRMGGSPVEPGFSYNSGSNSEFLSVEQLRRLIAAYSNAEQSAESMGFIPYSCQSITEDDIDAVDAVLRSEYITQGPVTTRFEAAFAALHQVEHAVAVANATAGLHIGCLALGGGPGSRVWTTPNSFVASANCALYCGASVDFVDIDPVTRNISVSALHNKLQSAAAAGPPPAGRGAG